MDAVSMTTRSLRDILQRAAEKDLGFKICSARDIAGPGGAIFIRANSELTERHLAWLEQRNPASGHASTFVDVVFIQEGARSLPAEVRQGEQPEESARQRRKKAEQGSKEVVARADSVVKQARAVFQIIGDMAFPESALRNPRVKANLQELDERIQQFHGAVKGALEEYLEGNTLIMELICQYGVGSREVQHGLNAAVLATEIATQVLLEGREWEGGDESDAAAYASASEEELRRELAEVFLGGFMHDCGLWGGDVDPEEGHEAAGARLVHSIPEIARLAPELVHIVLFHSEVVRLASRRGIVQIAEEDGGGRMKFRGEFFSTREDAQAALRLHAARGHAELLSEKELAAVLPVAQAEYFLTRSEGFDALSPATLVRRLANHAHSGLYERCAVALCNVQGIVPRRAYVVLEGTASILTEQEGGIRRMETHDFRGFEGGSIGHGDDPYSPHLILLFAPGEESGRRKLAYVDPLDSGFWGHSFRPGKRIYIAAGRHRDELAIRVTGFMSQEVYGSVLGEYEQELKRQMQI